MRLIRFQHAVLLLRLARVEMIVANTLDRWAEAAMRRSGQRLAEAHAIADRVGLAR